MFGQEPREASAQARWGVVEAWRQNFRASAQRLAKVAEREQCTLDFLLPLVRPSYRKHIGQVRLKCYWFQSAAQHYQEVTYTLLLSHFKPVVEFADPDSKPLFKKQMWCIGVNIEVTLFVSYSSFN